MKSLSVFLSFLVVSCGGSSGGGSSSSSDVKSVSEALDSAKSALSATIPDTSSIGFVGVKRTNTSINSEWTDSNYALGGDFGSSPRDFLLKQGDSTAQSSLMYRLQQALESLCIFSTALPSTNSVIDLNSNGSVTLDSSLKSTIKSSCDVDVDGLPDGTVVGFKVEDISGDTGPLFERKVSFDTDGNDTYNQYSQYFYYTIEKETFKFSYVEESSNDSVVFFDYRDGVFRFEFSEKDSAFTIHYRGTLDESSEKGLFTAYVNQNSDTSKVVVSTVENGGDEIAVSYSFDDNADTYDLVDGNACLTSSNMNIATDNSLVCTGVSGTAVSSWTTDLSGITSSYILGIDETSFLKFTNSANILSAGLAE